MNWLLFKHHLIENAKLIARSVLTASVIITTVILLVYLMTINAVTSFVVFLIGSWLVLTVIDYMKAKREKEAEEIADKVLNEYRMRGN